MVTMLIRSSEAISKLAESMLCERGNGGFHLGLDSEMCTRGIHPRVRYQIVQLGRPQLENMISVHTATSEVSR